MGNSTDYDGAASEFLRAVRGHRSQVAFARRLGYRANPITDWECGRRYPTAREALRAAARVGIDVAAAFSKFHPAVLLEKRDEQWALAPWLDALRGDRSLVALATDMNRSRFAVARFMRGAAHPRLPDFFRLVDAISGRLPELVSELVPIDEVPTLRARFASTRASQRLAVEEPWTEAILRVLESTPYRSRPRHDDELVARELGVEVFIVRRCMKRLREAAIIRRRGRRYAVVAELNVDTRTHPEALGVLRSHWSHVVSARAHALSDQETFGYNVMSLRREDLDEVRDILRRAYREIRSLVAASEPREVVALVTMAQLVLDERACRRHEP